ncbi:hypothetical protein OL548_34600 (plasmid) [Lysinibacillus sp. MHQ-1]|nr:hypothetical protein OL548_34600 [Lysinibacillus sp. MHQ-1]
MLKYFEHEVLDYTSEGLNPVLYPDEHKYSGRQIVENKKRTLLRRS